MLTADKNTLFYGDNLNILREHVADESVDLIYLDPPFNSNANYNVLFKSPTGEESPAQIEAFFDTWHWNDNAETAFDQVMQSGNTDAAEMLRAMRGFLKENDMMAYLAMMTVRMIELHRVLKPTGSLYLHCDPTASHYLKILLDAVFGPRSFTNEIVWKRTSAHSNATQKLGAVHDTILLYAKSEKSKWVQIFAPYSSAYTQEHFVHKDPDGRVFRRSDLVNPSVRPNLTYDFTARNGRTYKPHANGWKVSESVMRQLDKENRLFFPAKDDARLRKKIYLDESPGVPLTDVWDDLPPIHASAPERLGYPTQKPLALMERILTASSNEGDVVLDPFCGCGTTIHAAQKMNRKWVGIDITHLAIGLIKRRLTEAFPLAQLDILGLPKDAGAARMLAESDKYQFQFWALSMIEAVPYKGGRKGADGGVDGYIYFKPDGRMTEKAVVSVKGGANVGVGMIRDLIATIERERAKVGILLSLEDPTSKMRIEAATAGLYKPEGDQNQWRDGFPRIQILTIEDLFDGRKPHLPWIDSTVFKKAKREKIPGDVGVDQGDLGV